MITKKQRREARQRFMNQHKQDNMGNGYDKQLYARMAWDRMKTQEKSDQMLEQIAQDSQ
jgi:hypothetical protein